MSQLLRDERWSSALSLGILGLVLYTGHRQLVNFKERCVVRPGSTKSSSQNGENASGESDIVINDGKLLLTLEKAIKLDTLETIARGPSFDLRIAALKIICQRAMADDSYRQLLAQVASDSPTLRTRGLKSLRCVFQLVGPPNIPQATKAETFKVVIAALRKALKDRKAGVHPERTGEREGILFLAKTVAAGWIRTTELAIKAGFVDYLKELDEQDDGCVRKYLANRYGTHNLDSMLTELIEAVYVSRNGRRVCIEAGLAERPQQGDNQSNVNIEETLEVIITGQGGAPVWLETFASEFAEGLIEATRELPVRTHQALEQRSETAEVVDASESGSHAEDNSSREEEGSS